MSILSAGVIPLRKNAGKWQLLMLRSYRYWDFPKGECDPGEEPLLAAKRELLEETTIDKVEFNWGDIFYETEPYSKGKTARYYIAELKDDKEVRLTPNPETGIVEHHEYRWVNFEEALGLANPRIQKVIEWAKARSSSAS